MSQKYEFLRVSYILALILIISACSNQNLRTPGKAQYDPTPTLYITTGGRNAYPLNDQGTAILPTLTPIPPTETKDPAYPYPPTNTPFTPYPGPWCDEDYLKGATRTPTPSGSYIGFPPLTYVEAGTAAPEEIVKLLLEKYLDQFKLKQGKSRGLEDYAIRHISIDRTFKCRGPNQLENYYGNLGYSIKPVSKDYSSWLVGGASESGDGWITFGTHFVLIKTKSTYELKLTGNG